MPDAYRIRHGAYSVFAVLHWSTLNDHLIYCRYILDARSCEICGWTEIIKTNESIKVNYNFLNSNRIEIKPFFNGQLQSTVDSRHSQLHLFDINLCISKALTQIQLCRLSVLFACLGAMIIAVGATELEFTNSMKLNAKADISCGHRDSRIQISFAYKRFSMTLCLWHWCGKPVTHTHSILFNRLPNSHRNFIYFASIKCRNWWIRERCMHAFTIKGLFLRATLTFIQCECHTEVTHKTTRIECKCILYLYCACLRPYEFIGEIVNNEKIADGAKNGNIGCFSLELCVDLL